MIASIRPHGFRFTRLHPTKIDSATAILPSPKQSPESEPPSILGAGPIRPWNPPRRMANPGRRSFSRRKTIRRKEDPNQSGDDAIRRKHAPQESPASVDSDCHARPLRLRIWHPVHRSRHRINRLLPHRSAAPWQRITPFAPHLATKINAQQLPGHRML